MRNTQLNTQHCFVEQQQQQQSNNMESGTVTLNSSFSFAAESNNQRATTAIQLQQQPQRLQRSQQQQTISTNSLLSELPILITSNIGMRDSHKEYGAKKSKQVTAAFKVTLLHNSNLKWKKHT